MRLEHSIARLFLVASALLVASAVGLASQTARKPNFAGPELLRVGADPLNAEAGQMYPSPAVFDVDGDGRDELIVGCIGGRLSVYENEATEGEPRWKPCSPLKSVDGEDIKVSNW